VRFWALLGVAAVALAGATGQAYRPKPGETILQLVIAGKGEVNILLNTTAAPRITSRIIELTRSGFYNGQRFFRVEKSPKPFLVQIGDPSSRTKDINDPTLGSGGTGVRIPYEETGMPNVEGAVGLSTLPRDRDSGDCQFYILLGPARFLDGNYPVFGQVVQGMDVVRKIELGDTVTSATILKG
jgi:cyclophilin family peptidyl-prolyl cis-trans isomerase